MSKILISFLGDKATSKVNYKFNENEQYEFSYAASAVFKRYFSKNEAKNKIDKMIVLGTVNSDWYNLIKLNLLPLCSNTTISSCHDNISIENEVFNATKSFDTPKATNQSSVDEEIKTSDLSKMDIEKEDILLKEHHFQKIQELISDVITPYEFYTKNKITYSNEDISKLQKGVNESIGSYLNCHFEFIVHERESQTLLDQYSISKALLNSELIPEKSEIILDITNGLRAMPMLSFITIECLKQLKDVKLSRVYYAKVDFPASKYNNPKEVTDEIIGKLRQISLNQELYTEEEINQLLSDINAIANTSKNPSKCDVSKTDSNTKPKLDSKKSSINANFLILDDIDKVIEDGLLIGQYENTANFEDFCPFIAENGMQNNRELFKDIAENLEWGDSKTGLRLLKKDYKNIINHIDNKEVKAILKDQLSWISAKSDVESLKKLAAIYLHHRAYVLAINSLYHALDEDQLSYYGKRNSKGVKTSNNYLCQKYGRKTLDDFINKFRSVIVHMEDSVAAKSIFDNAKKALPAVCDDVFHKEIEEHFKKFGVKLIKDNKSKDLVSDNNTLNNNTPISSKNNVFLSFIGGGAYNTCLYNYNGQGIYDCTDTSKVPSFIGVMLQKYLHHNLDNSVSIFLMCGTETSNWAVFAESLSIVYPSTSDICAKIFEMYNSGNDNVCNSSDTRSLTPNEIEVINDLFKNAEAEIGFLIQLMLVSDDVSDKASLDTIKNTLTNCPFITSGAHLYLDVTHSFRMIPFFIYSEACALQSTRNIILEDVFYGDIDDDFLGTKSAEKLASTKVLFSLFRFRVDKEIYNTVTSQVISMLDEFMQAKGIECKILPCSGKVNGLQNLIRLHKTAINIGQYTRTGNLNFLAPVFKDEMSSNQASVSIAEGDGSNLSILDEFFLGNFYSNTSQIKAALPYLESVYQKLKNYENTNNPIFELVKPEILNQLSWLEQDVHYLEFLAKGRNLITTDLVKAVLYTYEGLKEYVYDAYSKYVIKSFSVILSSEKNAYLESRVNDPKLKQIDNYAISYCRECGIAKLNDIISEYGKEYHKKEKLINFVDNFILKDLVKNDWDLLREVRSNMFHHDFNKSKLENLEETLARIYKRFVS